STRPEKRSFTSAKSPDPMVHRSPPVKPPRVGHPVHSSSTKCVGSASPQRWAGHGHKAKGEGQNPHPNVGKPELGWDRIISATLGWGTRIRQPASECSYCRFKNEISLCPTAPAPARRFRCRILLGPALFGDGWSAGGCGADSDPIGFGRRCRF